MPTQAYTKHYLPLESNPRIFTQLIHALGASPALRFEDVYALDEPSLLPHPALALILTFHAPPDYEERRIAAITASQHIGAQSNEAGAEGGILWFKQTIYNACGFYAILHALCNGEGKRFIRPNSLLANFMQDCQSLSQEERAAKLEASEDIEQMYAQAARQGDSAVSENPEDEVDFHFVCFAKNDSGTQILELDGDKSGPVRRGKVSNRDEDMLGETGRNIIKEHFEREAGGSEGVAFNLMALTIDTSSTCLD